MRIPVYTDFEDQNLFQDDLNQEMQANLSNDGWVFPNQPTATITALSANATTGTAWVDNQTNQLKINLGGVLYYIPVVPV